MIRDLRGGDVGSEPAQHPQCSWSYTDRVLRPTTFHRWIFPPFEESVFFTEAAISGQPRKDA